MVNAVGVLILLLLCLVVAAAVGIGWLRDLRADVDDLESRVEALEAGADEGNETADRE